MTIDLTHLTIVKRVVNDQDPDVVENVVLNHYSLLTLDDIKATKVSRKQAYIRQKQLFLCR